MSELMYYQIIKQKSKDLFYRQCSVSEFKLKDVSFSVEDMPFQCFNQIHILKQKVSNVEKVSVVEGPNYQKGQSSKRLLKYF